MTLEELSVRFSADISPFAAAVAQLGSLLSQAGSQADSMATHFQAAGVNAGEGLREGLMSQRGGVAAAARALADAASSALRFALRIHSPSRLTYEVGQYFDEGLLRGIAGSAGRVEKEAGALGSRTAAALSISQLSQPVEPRAFSTPSGGGEGGQAAAPLSITVPLEIDGYRLGVAAIEGINRVSHGTGRVELSL